MKNKRKVNDLIISYRQKLLATSIAALCTGMVSSSVTQASDIDIYQEAKSGQITLMLLIDTSGSMTGSGSLDGTGAYRIDRVKTAMKDLLQGNATKNIQPISDDKVIGLATFGGTDGFIQVPARALGDKINGVTQRQILLNKVNSLSATGNTPTFRGFADVAAYMMGTNTQERASRSNNVYAIQYNSGGTKYRTCTDWNTNGTCKTFSSETTTNPVPAGSNLTSVNCTYTIGYSTYSGTCYQTNWYIKTATSYSGYPKSSADSKVLEEFRYRSPSSLIQTDEIKKCSGQGIYVLTDGEPNPTSQSASALMKNALVDTSFSCSGTGYSDDWSCAYKFNDNLLLNNSKTNPLGLKIKTAIVGFGSSFNSITSFDKSKTQQQNLDALGSINSDQKRAARWGIIGEGGWYSGNSSQDVVDSVNAFLGDLNKGIPAVTTGSPTIPKDSLNPSVLQKHAYYPQFQPTPDKAYQLWAGNLRKYDVVNGILKDKSGLNIVDNKGKLIDNYDLWSPAVSNDAGIAAGDVNTPGSELFAKKGGAWSQLKLRATSNVENRKLLTNRVQTGGSGTTTTFGDSSTLRQVKISDLTDVPYKYDADRGYLISLLGYSVDATQPDLINLTTAPELRQIGAVMHSSPVLITNKGTITYTNNILGSANREDYVLFGTTQGLLHVVDAKTGQEKFAFVPNEMVKNQKQAFINYDKTDGGIDKLFYGIDGAWTSYTEYVIDSYGNLTVGTGRGLNQEGKQFVYGGLRMGGRSYYALDLKNIDAPKLQFQISPDDQKVYYNGSSKSFSQLQYMGQSWSKPTIAWVRWGNQRKRVMFVGGGYDAAGSVQCGDATHNDPALTGYDSLNRYNNKGYECPNYNQSNQVGAGVYMFDADNGDLLWWASANATNTTSGVIGLKNDNLKYSVVSEIRNEDRDGDGLADHLYFGDLGGQLFRIDLDNKAASTATFAKTPRRLLNLNASGKSPRFYEMPAFSIYRHAGETFGVISIGSGNRSTPLLEYTVGTAGYDYDAVYNIYDKDVAAKDLYDSTHVFKTENLLKSDLGEVTQANRNDDTNLVAPYTAKGWYYRFQSNKLQSAKVFATPIVLNSRLFVSTFDASKPGLSGDCGAGVKGESFLNQFCMPFGQCPKPDLKSSIPEPECSTGDGCSIGPGIQNTAVVDSECDPATDPTCTKGGNKPPKPEDGTNNKNYCISTGNRSVTKGGGTIPAGTSKMCLIPQRWYERSR